MKLNSHDVSYIKSKIPQEPFELCIKLVEIWTGKIIGVQDVIQELKVIVEEFEVPRAPLEGMPMLSYPKSLQECIKESQQRFNKVIWGRKRKLTTIKPGGDLERRKKIKTNADKMALDEIEADDVECDKEQLKGMMEMIKGLKLKRAKKEKERIRQGNWVRKYRCESCFVTIGSEGICERCEESERERKRELPCMLCFVLIAGGGICQECRNKICEDWMGEIV